jgi:glycosyltransferase involved in cell wall biosynthesis
MPTHQIISVLVNASKSSNGVSLRNLVTSSPISLPIIFFTTRLPFLTQILVQNEKRKQSLVELGAPGNKVRVVKMGIDTNLFRPKREYDIGNSGNNNQKIKIAYFGPLTTSRGVDTLLQAYREVKSKHKDAELYLIGRSSKPSHIINSMISKLDLKNEVTVINQFLSETHLISLMQNFDVVISLLKSSVHSVEPPFIVLEAMSLAKPVISTPLNGVDEIITHKETGLLVKPNAAEDTARALGYILDDRKRGRIIGKKAREFIVNNHDAKIFLDDLSESIKKAVIA